MVSGRRIVLLGALVLFGCAKPVANEDVVGAWRSSDGAFMILHPDNTAEIRSFPLRRLVFPDSDGKKLPEYVSGNGRWAIRRTLSGDTIDLSIPHVFGHYLLIGGFRRPTELYAFEGDPDSGVRYVFTRDDDGHAAR